MNNYFTSTCDKIQESILKAYKFGIEDGNQGQIDVSIKMLTK